MIRALARQDDRNLLLTLVLIGIAALSTTWFLNHQARLHLLKEEALTSSMQWANFLLRHIEDFESILVSGQLSLEDRRVLAFAKGSGWGHPLQHLCA